MGTYGAPKLIRHTAGDLPDDLVHIIFLKLDFKSKVIAQQVCKKWNQLLKIAPAGARHWLVDYNVNTFTPSRARTSTGQLPIVEQFTATIGRWLMSRATAIKVVRVSATLSSVQQGVATRKVLESQLPLLAGCLAKHGNRLELTFRDGSPFASAQLSSSAFLTVLCPMVKRLRLWPFMVEISASQFAAICELSSLEELFIEAALDGAGLQEMTSDISKLVNLTTLCIHKSLSLQYIPESLSCLQNLEVLSIRETSITEVPSGLASLANLSSLGITGHSEPLHFPPSLQGLKSLTSVSLEDCSLKRIPEVMADLSTLTYLKLSENDFQTSDRWSWWPSTLSRLTRLAELVIPDCRIISLPPHISGLRQLTKLDVYCNDLRSLPEQLSSLQNLRVLRAGFNYLPTVPVSVLSSLTALTRISLNYQLSQASVTFHISSSLLPILHPGLVELDLRHSLHWDSLSLYHLGRAMMEIADRTPIPTLTFL